MSHGEDYGALSADKWKGQLDMDRSCGTLSSGETCWLCDDLTAFNRAVRAFGLELKESMPGTLLLQCTFEAQMDVDQVITAREASLLASSILRQHPCIQDLSVVCLYSGDYREGQPPFPSHMSPPSLILTCRRLRCLKIYQHASARMYLTDLVTITGLETLHIDVDEIDENFATQIDAVMERNHNTLKKVEVRDFRKRQSRLGAVERLVACEYLLLQSSITVNGIPDLNSVVKLMGVSTALKELGVTPITQADVSGIARALETNRSLTKLSLYVGTCHSIEELFRALELNKSLKELTVWAFEHADVHFMRAVASAMENNSTLTSLNIDARFVQCSGMQLWSEALSKNCALQVLALPSWNIPVTEVLALCKALRVNKTLRALDLSGVHTTDEERTTLVRQLLADECYDRVLLGAWTEPCLKILLPALRSLKKEHGGDVPTNHW
ncbi:hypothetical protein MTO96_040946 [Rhipicephalus appendiculatus]